MEKEKTDLDVLGRLWELSRLEKAPTTAQEKEFCELKGRLERRLDKSLALEEKTLRLVRYLMAA